MFFQAQGHTGFFGCYPAAVVKVTGSTQGS